jgi:iron complex transport system ATP-binding protein
MSADLFSVALRGVVVEVDGRRIVGPIDLDVRPGEHWVVLGPNGSGKTTLLAVIGARRSPTSGAVRVLGVTIGRDDVRKLHPRIGHFSHTLTEMMPPNLSVLDVVLTGKRSALVPWFDVHDETDKAQAQQRLAQVGMTAFAARAFATCSQGERQRVLLARALYGRSELLILDEPAAGLDLPARELLVSALEAASSGPSAPTTFLATHHVEEVPPSTTHAALLRDGRLIAAGPIDTTLTRHRLRETFELDVEVGRRNGRWWAVSAT